MAARMAADDEIDLVIADPKPNASWNKHGKRVWLILCSVIWLTVVAIVAGFVAWSVTKEENDSSLCTTAHCVITAGELLSNIDPSVDPCDNFYDFACGGWIKKHTIPVQKDSYATFSKLSDQEDIVVRDLLERKSPDDEIDAIKKAKDFYNACMDLDRIEEADAAPLLNLLNKYGGWPLLGYQDGGSWNETDYNFETLVAHLVRDGNRYDAILSINVWPEPNNTDNWVLWIETHSPNVPLKFFNNESYAEEKEEYLNLNIRLMTLLGAEEDIVNADMADVIEFITKFNNVTRSNDEEDTFNVNETDSDELRIFTHYNTEPTNIEELEEDLPQVNWTRLFDELMPEETKPILRNETIINPKPNITEPALQLISETPPRVIANYMLWSVTLRFIPYLSKRFRDVKYDLDRLLSDKKPDIYPRWKTCYGRSQEYFEWATGRMFIDEKFTGDSKKNIDKLVANVKKAFKEMLDYNPWLDDETKDAAREKCDAVKEQVGYPMWLHNDTQLNNRYEQLEVNKNDFFANLVKARRFNAYNFLLRLRQPGDTDDWSSGPVIVNAYYSPVSNSIFFPAGILQPPFYHAESPWYLNYGAIGSVIGHELTHGFDDSGRHYDKDGNHTDNWWTNSSIDNFVQHEKCIIDQYSEFIVPEINKTVDGNQTRNENIADNGGIREAFKALKDNNHPNVKLPGWEDYSSEQLFFLSFAQLWCRKDKADGDNLKFLLDFDPHSPGRFRVIGTLQNQIEFARAYNCPINSKMNPPAEDKCVIW